MSAYYNENDPFAADWLENLIERGLIPAGDVDRRSITEVCGDDVSGYVQCHFFAGVGGWSQALRLAGWPDGFPVWTGSCPCQPFSRVGRRRGARDKRHLWPEFRRLIAERRPAEVIGEQVESKDGRAWFAGVRADLEGMGYAVGGADLCAAGISAPHRRQRIFWVGYTDCPRRDSWPTLRSQCAEAGGAVPATGGQAGGLGDVFEPGLEGFGRHENNGDESGRFAAEPDGPAPETGAWSAFRVVRCRDGKDRRIPVAESGIQPLAYGVPRGMGRGRTGKQRLGISAARANRKERLKAYGNAIIPQLAAEFIGAYIEARLDT